MKVVLLIIITCLSDHASHHPRNAAVLYQSGREEKQKAVPYAPINSHHGFSSHPFDTPRLSSSPIDEGACDIHSRRPHRHFRHHLHHRILQVPQPRTGGYRRRCSNEQPGGAPLFRRGRRQAAGGILVHRVRKTERRRQPRRRRPVLGLPRHDAGRRDGAASSPVQAPLPRGVHRHVAGFAHDVPAVPTLSRRNKCCWCNVECVSL
jgi:hypothetical protein